MANSIAWRVLVDWQYNCLAPLASLVWVQSYSDTAISTQHQVVCLSSMLLLFKGNADKESGLFYWRLFTALIGKWTFRLLAHELVCRAIALLSTLSAYL